MMSFQLPAQHHALQLGSIETGLQVKKLPTPQPGLGNAIIRIEAAGILSYHRDVYNGSRHYSFPTPIIGGISAVGRITALGPDATALSEGQLVYVDCVIRARDNPDTLFLSAIHDSSADGSKKLMRDVWRDGTFAELCASLGYSVQDLAYMGYLLVPFGGLRDIKLEPGETIVISPATGGYGGAGVQVAIAMGARVIAMGRNEKELARLKEHVLHGSPNAQIETMKMTGDEAEELATLQTFGTIDAVLDLTPPQGSKSLHLRSATSALRRNGRVSMMGFVDQPIVPWTLVGKNITIRGKLMYEREDMIQFVKMLERGLFPRAKAFVDTRAFQLEDWKTGLDMAAEHTGIGKHVVFTP
ncbi:putative quinone oxidoreductase [Dothidotthia symphoricarpi CBS 119687]|uniref:Putative quinone oxidoreductase n=1 Tax=Dothidotthia symphoricarpi CBS 119687 TaxID=1392245 RepID=A0A6A6AAH7_9PLEO|nr:putative quinone oxidoreductase [Dothidotthia symphoricarpi CBS 119687]KAF2128094.1 putative quinone oxidoreductase [Dothidotthia symphoricarpi CBS 119687]